MIAQESSANFVEVTVHIQWFFKKPNFQMWANLGHQIVLRHKYCESPAQMRLVFKYVEYLPGREKGIRNRWVVQFLGSSIFIFRRKGTEPVMKVGVWEDAVHSPTNWSQLGNATLLKMWAFKLLEVQRSHGCWNWRCLGDHCKCRLTLMETLLGKYLLLLRRHAAPSSVCLV